MAMIESLPNETLCKIMDMLKFPSSLELEYERGARGGRVGAGPSFH